MDNLRLYNADIILHLRASPNSWVSLRAGKGWRLPSDLREAFNQAKEYGRIYGRHVYGFEIDNEPDIDFINENPETYMAFLKAMYLGIHQGIDKNGPTESSESKNAISTHTKYELSSSGKLSDSLVIMAPLAFPPGPYLERLSQNGLLSYTDGFNYHYYGFSEDFTGVYQQFEAAVQGDCGNRLPAIYSIEAIKGSRFQSSFPMVRRQLPVFLTEYGYGAMLGGDGDTVEGRVRQWRWFSKVVPQIRRLRIAGPMAFYVPPYFEAGAMEFGLTMVPKERTAFALSGNTPLVELGTGGEVRTERHEDDPLRYIAGGLAFAPNDFGDDQDRPWMKRIGTRVGQNEATPALAWLLDYGRRHPYRPRDWEIEAVAPSPIVLDFIAGTSLLQVKRYGGYLVQHDPKGDLMVDGTVVIYNFSDHPVVGRLLTEIGSEANGQLGAKEVAGLPARDRDTINATVALLPGERRIISVRFSIKDGLFAPQDWRLQFVSEDSAIPPAFFSTQLYPEAAGMTQTVLKKFDHPDSAAAANRVLLERRPLALEETPYANDGRWRVAQGVSVSESSDGVWRFRIARPPIFSYGTSSAELPLDDAFEFPEDGVFSFSYRLTGLRPENATVALPFDVYFRTANGNLYQVWPRSYARATWSVYMEAKGNYTMGFYSRASLPWRFRDNRPVALVFRFRPGGQIPITFEIARARIERLEKK